MLQRLRTVLGHLGHHCHSSSSSCSSTSTATTSKTTLKNYHSTSSSSSSSSSPSYPTFKPTMSTSLPNCEFVKFHSRGSVKIIELDRPAALHALNMEMVQAMLSALLAWKDKDCSMIIIKSHNASTKVRSFCAGGDVVSLIKNNKASVETGTEFFRQEYSLNHLIGTYPKPIISLIDGITMGGGAGISVHGPFRIATENTVFAMPETAIGFFPDVGGSFFLPRLEGGLGKFLALTGYRLKGIDCYHAGIATHYVPSTRIEDLVESLVKSSSSLDLANLSNYIEQFSGELEAYNLEPHLNVINDCFSGSDAESVLGIINKLKNYNQSSNSNDNVNWILDLISTQSPTSLAVTLELLERGRQKSLKACLAMELDLARNFFQSVPDMHEGITSKLINKSKEMPKWDPSDLSLITPTSVAALFNPISNVPTMLQFQNDIDYLQYPHQDNALPTIDRIKKLVNLPRNSTLEQLQAFVEQYCYKHGEKLGLREKLQKTISKHIVKRTNIATDNAPLMWI